MILDLLFALFGFLFSPIGLFVFLLGLVLFLAVAVVPVLTGGIGQRLSNIHLFLSAWLLQRASIVVSEHNDILYKRMEFDDRGVETMSFGTETKEFEDPAGALHTWMGFPFALADEVHGILFDPRHAAIGARKHAAELKNEMSVRATQSEFDSYNVYEWVRGVFEFPEDTHELVDLSKVRMLVPGSERAEHPERIETMYKNSRIPYVSRESIVRLLMPVVAVLATFGGLWLMASQGGSGGGGGGSSVSYGSVLFGMLASTKSVDWKHSLKVLAVALPIPTIFLLVFVLVSPILAIISFIIFTMGFLFLPFLTIAARTSTLISGALARFYLRLGLLGYRKPVFKWKPEKYVLVEFDELDNPERVDWYSLAGTVVGFSFEPGPESWGAELVDTDEMEKRAEVDGPTGNIPTGFTKYPDMTRAVYAAFVPSPSKLNRNALYVHSGIALSWFKSAAIGEKSHRRLLDAKDKYGEGGWGLSDKSLLYMTGGGALFGTILGVFVFFL